MGKKQREGRIQSLKMVEGALECIAEQEAAALQIQTELEGKISALRASYARLIEPYAEAAKELRENVQIFAEDHPELFEPKRSVDLTHGRIGFRQVTSIRLLKKAETVIAALEDRGLQDAVIVKKTPNKDVLAAYDDETLRAVGAKRQARDEFYIDLKGEKDVASVPR